MKIELFLKIGVVAGCLVTICANYFTFFAVGITIADLTSMDIKYENVKECNDEFDNLTYTITSTDKRRFAVEKDLFKLFDVESIKMGLNRGEQLKVYVRGASIVDDNYYVVYGIASNKNLYLDVEQVLNKINGRTIVDYVGCVIFTGLNLVLIVIYVLFKKNKIEIDGNYNNQF